jgi:ribosomal protein S18 acetylase RimI-like enzyme
MEHDHEEMEENTEELWRKHKVLHDGGGGVCEIEKIATDGVAGELVVHTKVLICEDHSVMVIINPRHTDMVDRESRRMRRLGWKTEDPIYKPGHVSMSIKLEFETKPPLQYNPLTYMQYNDEHHRTIIRDLLENDFDPTTNIGFFYNADAVCSETNTVLACMGDSIVGFLTTCPHDEGEISMVSVFGPYRRQGFGRCIVYDFEASYHILHGRCADFPVHAEHIIDGAVPFWKSVGWKVVNKHGVGNHRPNPARYDILTPMVDRMCDVYDME